MNTLWPAATIALAVTGFFALSNYYSPAVDQPSLDDCHRLAGEVQAIHVNGGTIPVEKLTAARGCAVSFGQNWAAGGGDRAAQLRAEGAMRVQ
ncbi:hypothetical protein D3C87_1560150 [compost metagenome]